MQVKMGSIFDVLSLVLTCSLLKLIFQAHQTSFKSVSYEQPNSEHRLDENKEQRSLHFCQPCLAPKRGMRMILSCCVFYVYGRELIDH